MTSEDKAFKLKYLNLHPSIKVTEVVPVRNVCRNRLTKVLPKENQYKKSERKTKVADLFGYSKATSNLDSARQSITGLVGNVELSIKKLCISKECLEHLAKTYGEQATIFLKWVFLDFSKSRSPNKKILEMSGSLINHTEKYQCLLDSTFITAINKKPIVFELHAANDYKEDVIALGAIIISNLLKKIGSTAFGTIEIFTSDQTSLFAVLTISYKLDCDESSITSLIKGLQMLDDEGIDFAIDISPEKTEDILITDTLESSLIRLNTMKFSKIEGAKELNERVTWLHQECNWKRTLQEFFILKGEDPFNIKYRQWRDNYTKDLKVRSFPSTLSIPLPEFKIEIKTLTLDSTCLLMRDDNIKEIYIEYDFIYFNDASMETPRSLPKKETIHFNFIKYFPIDMKENACECKLLAAKICNQESIRFRLINEPVYSYSNPIQSCSELGFAEVILFDLVQNLENILTMEIPVKPSNHGVEIGTLSVQFTGILALRRMALFLLAPDDYDLLE